MHDADRCEVHDVDEVRKRISFAMPFILKMIVLPRQARDKHRENSNRVAFLQGVDYRLCGSAAENSTYFVGEQQDPAVTKQSSFHFSIT